VSRATPYGTHPSRNLGPLPSMTDFQAGVGGVVDGLDNRTVYRINSQRLMVGGELQNAMRDIYQDTQEQRSVLPPIGRFPR